MKLIFTLDDGLKSHLRFYDEMRYPATYFIIPHYTNQAYPEGKFWERICIWEEVKLLSEFGEIGFHGHSAKSYNQWPEERVKQRMEEGMKMFQENIGKKPVSFAYTDMNPGRIDIISKYCPYIRDYFWRDVKNCKWGDDILDQKFRVDESQVPKEFIKYRSEIFVMHLFENFEAMKQRVESISMNFKYLVLIAHNISNMGYETWKEIAKGYEVILFREIFE